jgi:2,3-bisphosphoglycerate-dependent phosphoglycerate mutase
MGSTLQLVLVRHGQSVWNTQHRLSGWADIGLTQRGRDQVAAAGQLLARSGFVFDEVYTSQLRRASDSTEIVLRELACGALPVYQEWRLNERHYGALEGLGPVAAVLKFGFRQVIQCQRRFDVSPPPLALEDPRFPGNQSRFSEIPAECWPRAESMAQAWERVEPVWNERMSPAVRAGRRLLVVAHKNTLRVLIKQISGLAGEQVERLAIRTAQPLIIEMNSNLELQRAYFLENQKPLIV